MKLSPCGVIKKGELTKSPPLDSKRKKRWMKRFFVLYKPAEEHDITDEEYEKEKENYLKNQLKTKRSSFAKLFRSTQENKSKQIFLVNCLSLFYYENAEKEIHGSPPLNHIPLTGAFVCESPEPVNGHKYVIDLQTASRKFLLCADSEEEHKSWLEKLKETIEATELRRNSIFTANESDPSPEELLGDGGLQYELDKLKSERIQQVEDCAPGSLVGFNDANDIHNGQELKPEIKPRTHLNRENSEYRARDSQVSYDVNSQILDTSQDDDYDVPPTSTNKKNSQLYPGAISQILDTSEDDVYDVPPTSSNDNNSQLKPGAVYQIQDTSQDDVYDVPPTSSKNNNSQLKPGAVYQIQDTSQDDVYDVPPTSPNNNNSQLKPGVNYQIQDTSQDDVYDVPPTSSKNNNSQLKPGAVYQIQDTSQDDVYDVPPTSSNSKNFQLTPGVNYQTLDTSEEDVYDVPPTSLTTNNPKLNNCMNSEPLSNVILDNHNGYVNVKRERIVAPIPNRSSKPKVINNQIASYYGNVDEVLNSTTYENSDAYAIQLTVLNRLESPHIMNSAEENNEIYEIPPTQVSITGDKNRNFSDTNNNNTYFNNNQANGVNKNLPSTRSVSPFYPKQNNIQSSLERQRFPLEQPKNFDDDYETMTPNNAVSKDLTLERSCKALPAEPTCRGPIIAEKPNQRSTVEDALSRIRFNSENVPDRRLLNPKPELPSRAPHYQQSEWKCSSLPTFYDTSFDDGFQCNPNRLSLDARRSPRQNEMQEDYEPMTPVSAGKNELEDGYQPMAPVSTDKQKWTDALDNEGYLKMKPSLSPNRDQAGYDNFAPKVPNHGPNRFRRSAPENY